MKIDKVVVFHVGARDHYLIAEYFSKRKLLHIFITDYWIKPKSWISKMFPSVTSRRFNPRIEKEFITSYNLFYFLFSLLTKKLFAKNKFKLWIIHDSYFAKWASRKVSDGVKNNGNYLIWGYTNASLEVLNAYKDRRNVVTLHNQIDPGIEYYRIQEKLSIEHPFCETRVIESSSEFLNRVSTEWRLADIILVNSTYSKQSLLKHGVPGNKIVVVPLPFSNNYNVKPQPRMISTSKLKVGFVGNINLIKGFDLFFKSAFILNSEMDFVAVGNVLMADDYISEAKKYITFKGHLSKLEMVELYQDLDVLVFPTYSDGFGMVQLEAMSFGVPVIASSNCGDVVVDGISGYIIEHDASAIVTRLRALDANRDLLQKFSIAAFERCLDFSYDNFQLRLVAELAKHQVSIL